MSRNLAPALLSSPSDIVEYNVADASPVDPNAPNGFIERFIHSEVLKRFSNISSVVHSHSPDVIPYGLSGVPLRANLHTAGFLGEEVPVFNILDFYTAGEVQDLLVRSVPLGAALASFFSTANSTASSSSPFSNSTQLVNPDHAVVLMSNHGFTTAASSIQVATFQAVYTQVAADVETTSLLIRNAFRGDGERGLRFLTPQEQVDSFNTIVGTVDRPWGLWTSQVENSGQYVNVLDSNQTDWSGSICSEMRMG